MKTMMVKGCSKGEIGRRLQIRSHVMQDVIDLPGIDVEGDILFDEVKVAYDKEHLNRPYFAFSDGKVLTAYVSDMRSISPELDCDVLEVHFGRDDAPTMDVRWDLNEIEMQNMIPKGLFGSDYMVDKEGEDNPNNRPRGGEGLRFPDEFTSTNFEKIPMKMHLRMYVDTDPETGSPIPIISLLPELTDGLFRTNSRVSGYVDLSPFIPDKEYYAVDAIKNDFDSVITIDDPIGVDKDKSKSDVKPIAKPQMPKQFMTPSEQQEADYLERMGRQIEKNVGGYDTRDEHTKDLDPEHIILVDPLEDIAMQYDDELLTYEEMVAMGIAYDYSAMADAVAQVIKEEEQKKTETAQTLGTLVVPDDPELMNIDMDDVSREDSSDHTGAADRLFATGESLSEKEEQEDTELGQ